MATISYDLNGGVGRLGAQVLSGKIGTALWPFIPSRSGYRFVEWNTASGGTGTSYQPGSNLMSSTDVTLYAIWTSAAYPSQDIFLYHDARCCSQEYIEGESSFSIDNNGKVRASTFTESSVSGGDFAISASFIAGELIEGNSVISYLTDGSNYLTDNSGNRLYCDDIR